MRSCVVYNSGHLDGVVDVGLGGEDGEQDVVELVLCHGDGVVRRVDQLVDLLVVPLHHLEQLAHVRTRIAHKFRHLEVFFAK